MQLGVNTILFGGFDLPTAFAQIANCGYDGVEISAIEVFGEKHLILDIESLMNTDEPNAAIMYIIFNFTRKTTGIPGKSSFIGCV